MPGVEKPKRFATCCGQPLIPTMHVPKAELYCLKCGASYGMFGAPGSRPATPELQETWERISSEWDEHVGGNLLIPRSMRRDCRQCERSSFEYDHPAHATEEEKEADRKAREWLAMQITNVC